MRNRSWYISRLGDNIIVRVKTYYEIYWLGFETLASLLSASGRRHLSSRQIVNQILFTGVDALIIVGLVGLSGGVIIALQAIINMPKIGASEYFGKIMVVAVIRELGPFLTSLIVAGRSGSALAAYIGNMRVTKELSALEVMGISPIHFIVLPALLGMLLSIACLTIYFDLIAVVGGVGVATIVVHVPFNIFSMDILNAITYWDIGLSFVKCVIFGLFTTIISCYHGLSADNIRMVPRVVHRTVIESLTVTIFINAIITVIFYALRNPIR